MAAQDPQSRRWSLTINNPKDCGLDHDTIIERLHLFHPRYFCLADEIGESGTYHTHIYLFSHSPIRFSTVWEKANLNLEEAAAYFGIGINKLRDMTNENNCPFVLWNGNKRLIKRRAFERFLDSSYSI